MLPEMNWKREKYWLYYGGLLIYMIQFLAKLCFNIEKVFQETLWVG